MKIIDFIHTYNISAISNNHTYPINIMKNNFGIGIQNPKEKLHVHHDTKSINIDGDIYLSGDVKDDSDNVMFALNNHVHHPEHILNSNITWDNINNRLGIGVSQPSTSVDVNGDVNCTSLYKNGVEVSSIHGNTSSYANASYGTVNHNYSEDSGESYVDTTHSVSFEHGLGSELTKLTKGFILYEKYGQFALYKINDNSKASYLFSTNSEHTIGDEVTIGSSTVSVLQNDKINWINNNEDQVYFFMIAQ